MTFKLAIRNLFRNGRRTATNLLMIAGGFIAVVVFSGFSANVLESVKWGVVNSQFGHIQIASSKLWTRNSEDSFRDRQLLEPEKIREQVRGIPGVKSVSLRQAFYGLVSTGERTVAAQIIGYEPSVEKEVLSSETIIDGEMFEEGADALPVAAIGEGLAKQIGVTPGQNITLVSQTADGAINAVDAEAKSIFRTVIQEIDDTSIFIPLPLSQKLVDLDSAERVVIKLARHEDVPSVLASINQKLQRGTEAKSWRELARLYNQTEQFFDVQNAVVATIIFALVFLATMSAVSMSVTERTGEIGTLRAIGRTRFDIQRLFTIEGFLLGIVGSIIGTSLGLLTAQAINQIGLPIVLPGATEPIPVRITFVLSAYITAFGATILASVFASLLSARRASRMKIVDCLKYNI